MLIQQAGGTHDALEGGRPLGVEPVVVVQGLRTVDGEAHEEAVGGQELTPLVGKQQAVGLQAVVYLATTGIAPLQVERPPIEAEGAQQRLAAMPGEEHLRHSLCLYVLAGEGLQELVAELLFLPFVECCLL